MNGLSSHLLAKHDLCLAASTWLSNASRVTPALFLIKSFAWQPIDFYGQEPRMSGDAKEFNFAAGVGGECHGGKDGIKTTSPWHLGVTSSC